MIKHILILALFQCCLFGSYGLQLKSITGLFGGLGLKKDNSINNRALADAKKKELFALAKGCKNGLKATPEKKESILQIAKELEKLNPTKAIATNSLLDGSWELIFTTNEGSSAGKLGPFIGQVVQDIDLNNQKYVNYVRLPLVEGGLDATWENKGANTWIVKFLSINFKVLNISILKKDLKALGEWRLSYLDDTLRILYAKSGKNAPENIYILRK